MHSNPWLDLNKPLSDWTVNYQTFKIGSMAFIFSHIASKRKTRKTEPQWNGPVKCTGIFNNGIHYTFDKVIDNKRVHFSMIKPHIPKKGEPESYLCAHR